MGDWICTACGNPCSKAYCDCGSGWENIDCGTEIIAAQAVKFDSGKARFDLLPPAALRGIAHVFTYGAKKYADFNYKNGDGLDWDRPYAALMRHMNAWNSGEDNDQESGASHLYHAGCCIMMLIDLVNSGIGKDTRFKTEETPNVSWKSQSPAQSVTKTC